MPHTGAWNCYRLLIAVSHMRLSVQYLNDADGNVQAVQVPVGEWKKLLKELEARKNERKVKADVAAALQEVAEMRKSNSRPQSLKEFLREL